MTIARRKFLAASTRTHPLLHVVGLAISIAIAGCTRTTKPTDLSASTSASSHREMLEILGDIAERTTEHPYLGMQRVRHRLARQGHAATVFDRIVARSELGQEELNVGKYRSRDRTSHDGARVISSETSLWEQFRLAVSRFADAKTIHRERPRSTRRRRRLHVGERFHRQLPSHQLQHGAVRGNHSIALRHIMEKQRPSILPF